jgi:hypothetical protein
LKGAGKMGRTAHPGRAILHLALVLAHIVGEAFHVRDRQLGSRDQKQRLEDGQAHGLEILDRVVCHLLAQPLALRERINVPHHNRVSIGLRLCRTRDTDQAGRSSDILDDNRLFQTL